MANREDEQTAAGVAGHNGAATFATGEQGFKRVNAEASGFGCGVAGVASLGENGTHFLFEEVRSGGGLQGEQE